MLYNDVICYRMLEAFTVILDQTTWAQALLVSRLHKDSCAVGLCAALKNMEAATVSRRPGLVASTSHMTDAKVIFLVHSSNCDEQRTPLHAAGAC